MTKAEQSKAPGWRRLGFANIVALIALFVALGGGAVASSHLINTSDIKNKAVTTKKLDKKAVTGSRLDKEAVKKSKIKDAAVTESKIDEGAVTDSKLSTDTRARWAVVRANGTLERGKGVVSSGRANGGTALHRRTARPAPLEWRDVRRGDAACRAGNIPAGRMRPHRGSPNARGTI